MLDGQTSQTSDPVELILEDSLDESVDVRRDVALKLAAGLAVFGLTGFVPGFLFGEAIRLSRGQRGAATLLAASAVCYVSIELWRSASFSIERWEERWKSAYSSFRLTLVEGIPILKGRVTLALEEDARRVRNERLREYEREEEALVRKRDQALEEREGLSSNSESQAGAAADVSPSDPDRLRARRAILDQTIDECNAQLLLVQRERSSVDQSAGLSALSRFETFTDSEIRRLRVSFGIDDGPSGRLPDQLEFAAPEAERARHLLGKDARFAALRSRYEERRWIGPRVPVVLSIGLLTVSLVFFFFSPWAMLGEPEPSRSLADVLDHQGSALRALLGPLLTKQPESEGIPVVSINRPGFQALALPVFEKDSAEIAEGQRDAVLALLEPILRDVARCATGEAHPVVHLVGFADRGCLNNTCDEASRLRNIELANERAQVVRDLVAREGLPIDIPVRKWTLEEHGIMLREATLSGFVPEGRYEDPKERVNRRVELRLVDSGGACRSGSFPLLAKAANRRIR